MEIKEFNVIKKVEKLSYPQDWESYNAAKTKEKTISLELLLELLDFFDEEEKTKHGCGRPAFTLKEQVLCMFVYTYSRFSSRRAIPDIEMAKRRELLSRTPHFNSVLNFFKPLRMTRILLELVEITSLPMKMFEDHLTIDSSGFSTSMFDRWLDFRTEKPSKIRHWRKINLIVGPRTNIVASITITDGNDADCPELAPLVKRATKHFNVREISADKAYLSRNNLRAIAATGAIPYIPFKKNTKQNPKGCKLWKAMFTYFYTNQEEFMKHYHQRSNCESTFSMIKRLFGNRLRTKGDNSQVNEALMKCLCHNLAVLVSESFERGLDLDLKKCAKEYFAQR